MNIAPRRSSALLAWTLWVLLALLPLRGAANVLMHLPSDGPSTAAVSAAPCHGEAVSDDAPGHADSCTLCDLCHGTALPGFVSTPGADRARSTWAAAQATDPPAGPPSPFFRPPRA